jgi:hypothetical protein
MSGNSSERIVVVTASARSLPFREICGIGKGHAAQEPDHWHNRLLCACGNGQSSSR